MDLGQFIAFSNIIYSNNLVLTLVNLILIFYLTYNNQGIGMSTNDWCGTGQVMWDGF